jgi:hypothetical protein
MLLLVPKRPKKSTMNMLLQQLQLVPKLSKKKFSKQPMYLKKKPLKQPKWVLNMLKLVMNI